MFILNERLAADTIEIMDLEVSKLLLMNDSRYLWLILVPRIENAVEIHNLEPDIQSKVFNEIMMVSKIVAGIEGVEKLNTGALGNVVSQLHIHIIGRNKNDFAWPAPVWGNGKAAPYNDAAELISKIKSAIA